MYGFFLVLVERERQGERPSLSVSVLELCVALSYLCSLASVPALQMMLVETVFADLFTYLKENIADVLIITGTFLVLICSLFGYFVYLLFMNKDEANKDRLLNVLYANLSYCFILNSGFLFLRFLQLKLFGINTFAFCLLVRCRQFLGPFTLLLFLQISLVTSISHYNPTYYLELSLKWKRLPLLCLQVSYP